VSGKSICIDPQVITGRTAAQCRDNVTFLMTKSLAMGRRGFDLSGDLAVRSDPPAAMAFPLLDILMFAVLFAAAYLYRHRSAIHKRLMLLAVFGALMPAPVAHLTGHFAFFRDKGFLTPVIIAAFLAVCGIHDRIALHRIHPVSLWIALTIFILNILCFADLVHH
jgi:hypothetical protein